ncbi:MAG: hypothetical protein WC683_06090 [bacterium]
MRYVWVMLMLVLCLVVAGCANRIENKGGEVAAQFNKQTDTAEEKVGKRTTLTLVPKPAPVLAPVPPTSPSEPEKEPLPTKMWFGGGEFVLPPGYVPQVVVEEGLESKSDKSKYAGDYEGKGPTQHDNSGKSEGFEPGVPDVNIDENGINSDTNKSKLRVKLPDGQEAWLIAGAGILCLVAAGLLYWWKRDILLSAVVGGSGVILIAFAFYNWLALLGFIAILALLIYWAKKTGKLEYINSLFVKSTEQVKVQDPTAGTAITSTIAEKAKADGTETLVRDFVDSKV